MKVFTVKCRNVQVSSRCQRNCRADGTAPAFAAVAAIPGVQCTAPTASDADKNSLRFQAIPVSRARSVPR
ncbi:hypothetical protein GCM10022270_09780 [Terriglobus aquaticus]